jgi:3-deoxy-manno-octulosonate cytidylyltransferase (CMP-KDO synthetase)
MLSRVVTLIPARLGATRLPNKPLLDINGKSLIGRVCENAKKYIKDSDFYVAAGEQEIVSECEKVGVRAILTDPTLPSGSDRIAAALREIDPNGTKYDIVVNFQGDSINVDPRVNLPLIEMIADGKCDIATCGLVFQSQQAVENPTNVKMVMGLKPDEKEGRVLYFTRAPCPFIQKQEARDKNFYHHIGVYVYNAESLKRMVSLPVSILEERESLEQLRALEDGMVIRAKIITVNEMKLIPHAPADINTIEELEEIRRAFVGV